MTVLCTICGKLIPDAEADTHCDAVHGEGGWRDIETAPKDGTMVLVAFPKYEPGHPSECPDAKITGYHVCSSFNQGDAWEEDCHLEACGPYFGDDFEYDQPTHWQPLPPPPKVSK